MGRLPAKTIPFLLVAIARFAFDAGIADAAPSTWTVTLHSSDIVAGEKLQTLRGRHRWNWKFDEQDGKFEIAVRKTAFPAPATGCRSDYLILAMPLYYPENPKQAPMAERRAVYNSLLAMQAAGKGSFSAHVETLFDTGKGIDGCNIYFVLPLAEDAAKLLP